MMTKEGSSKFVKIMIPSAVVSMVGCCNVSHIV